MIDVVFLILFFVMAVRVAISVYRESAIFREFKQSRALGVFVFLFPLGPVALIAGVGRLGAVVAFALAAACYIPGLMMARRVGYALERAGTDRVKRARSAASQALGTAIIGLLYVAVLFVLTFAIALI